MTACRVNPTLRLVPVFDEDDPQLAIEDLAHNRQHALVDDALLAVLAEFASWTDRGAAVEALGRRFGLDADAAAGLVEDLLERQFLVTDDDPVVEREERLRGWAEDGWSDALELYRCLYDHPYWRHERARQYERDHQLTPEYLAEMPPPYRRHDGETVDLPAVGDPGSLPAVADVLGPGDGADAAAGPTRETLSRALFYAFGEVDRKQTAGDTAYLLKTSPSGGARHPTEAYLVAPEDGAVPAGVYHYAVEDHALVRLAGSVPAPLAERLGEASAGLDAEVEWFVFLAAVVERVMWRYRNPRAFRVVCHDAGHLVETLGLVCRAQGLAARFVADVPGPEVAAALGVDPLAEPVLGCVAVGPAPDAGGRPGE